MYKNSGFSLLEVLIAALIVSIGVTALSVLQSKLTLSFQAAEIRQLANQLAAQKLSDLRQLSSINGSLQGPSYTQIQHNSGGTMPAGPTQIVLDPARQVSHTFDLNWSVTEQLFIDSDNDGTADLWVDESQLVDPSLEQMQHQRKQVIVTVTWTDPVGRAKQVIQRGSVIPVYENASRLNLGANSEPEKVPSISTEIASIVHQISEKQQSRIEHIALAAIFSDDLTSVTTTDIQRRESDKKLIRKTEFNTLACTCQLQGEGQGKTPATYQIQGNRLTSVKGKWITKPIASAIEGQAPLCNLCCRDHHDNLSMVSEGNGYRQHLQTPHRHFTKNSHGRYMLAQQVGDLYQEVCRFRREDGLFELTYDWHAIQSVILSEPLNEHLQSSYQEFVETTLRAYVLGEEMPQSPFTDTVHLTTSKRQLQSRTLYVDPISSADHGVIIQRLESQQLSWKSMLSFYDFDTTLQSHWHTSNPNLVAVSNEPKNVTIEMVSNHFGTYSRGKLTGLNAGQTTVISNILSGNEGILGVTEIEPLNQRRSPQHETRIADYHPVQRQTHLAGLIHCIDTRFEPIRKCNLHNQDRADYLSLMPLKINTSASTQLCTLSFPLSGATASFVCPQVASDWQGQILADTEELPQSISVYWLSPEGRRIDNHRAEVSQISLHSTEGQFQLVIQII